MREWGGLLSSVLIPCLHSSFRFSSPPLHLSFPSASSRSFSLLPLSLFQDGADNIGGPWHMIILAVSVACFGLSIGMTVVMFLWFGKNTADPAEEGGCEVRAFSHVFWSARAV